MRVMFVGGGRRVSLAKRFITAGFEVFSYETEKKCPVSSVATVVEGKKWTDPSVEQHILDTFYSYGIDVAIPLQDHATVVLSRIAQLTNAKIPTATETINNMCLNKRVFEQQLKDYDFYPSITNSCKKVIIKPKFGFASKGIKVVERSDLADVGDDFVVQRFIDSGYEISVDAYFNKNSKMIDAIPRRRLEIQGGEVSRSITLDRNAFGVLETTKLVGEKFGLVGPACVQYIVDDNKAFIMEINARFGGGVILSLEAGFDIVDLIKKEYVDNVECLPMNYGWKENFGMVRYFQEYFYE